MSDTQVTGKIPNLRELIKLRRMSKPIVCAAIRINGYELANMLHTGRALPSEQEALASFFNLDMSDLLLILEETHRRPGGKPRGGYKPRVQDAQTQKPGAAHDERADNEPGADAGTQKQEEACVEEAEAEGDA